MSWKIVKFLWRPYKASDDENELVGRRFNATDGGAPRLAVMEKRLATVEGKSGVLLTHISMMIGITGIMFSVGGKNQIYQSALALELIMYLVLALLCIRCQYQFDSADFDALPEKQNDEYKQPIAHQYQRIVSGELIIREKLFRFIFRSLYLLTVALVLTIMIAVLSTVRANFSEAIIP